MWWGAVIRLELLGGLAQHWEKVTQPVYGPQNYVEWFRHVNRKYVTHRLTGWFSVITKFLMEGEQILCDGWEIVDHWLLLCTETNTSYAGYPGACWWWWWRGWGGTRGGAPTPPSPHQPPMWMWRGDWDRRTGWCDTTVIMVSRIIFTRKLQNKTRAKLCCQLHFLSNLLVLQCKDCNAVLQLQVSWTTNLHRPPLLLRGHPHLQPLLEACTPREQKGWLTFVQSGSIPAMIKNILLITLQSVLQLLCYY